MCVNSGETYKMIKKQKEFQSFIEKYLKIYQLNIFTGVFARGKF
jgi:hypothetical protein